jgi:hypothetical protein
MIGYISPVIITIVLFELFAFLRISKEAMAIVTRSRESMHILLSPEFGDQEKEAVTRRESAEIFRLTLRLSAKLGVSGLFLYLVFLLFVVHFPDLKGWIREGIFSPVAIVTLTATVVCYAWVRRAILGRL